MPWADPDRVPIGRFAQAARVTVKALRHYQAVGVLEPDHIDPDSNYRYYRWSQLGDALCVTTLRDLGVPLEGIRAHLVEGVPLHEILAAERIRLTRQAARAERALATIEMLRGAPELPAAVADVVEWPDRSTLTVRGPAHADSLGADATALIGRLLARAGRLGLDTSGPVLGEYPLTLSGSMTISVRLEVDGMAGELDRMPGGRFARVVHTGPFESLGLAYHGLVRWLHEQRHRATGPVYERYLEDPASTAPELLRTEVLHRIG